MNMKVAPATLTRTSILKPGMRLMILVERAAMDTTELCNAY